MCEYIILEDFKMDRYIYDENNGLWYELQRECEFGLAMAVYNLTGFAAIRVTNPSWPKQIDKPLVFYPHLSFR